MSFVCPENHIGLILADFQSARQVSRVTIQSVPAACDTIDLEGKFLHVDYSVDCDSDLYRSVTAPLAWIFVAIWPVGTLLLLLAAMLWYKWRGPNSVPEISLHCIQK